MNPGDPDDLLMDALAETTPVEFRAAVLQDALRCAHRRRNVRTLRRISAGVGVFVVAVILVWRGVVPPDARWHDRAYALVKTGELPSIQPVSTTPGAVTLVRDAPTDVAVVRTETTRPGFHVITDEQLLALAAPNRAVLVHVAPHESQLIFADAAERSSL